ncbi:manganese catalase family protein [Cupriavidus pauculus]|uniref:manganese catalase family protein n=1 Tax=Cupriavidus pauculus TaxID=82633 RepID=UPI0021DF48C6|nr:manganese catalase family protein [Cupriavidus pauculus]
MNITDAPGVQEALGFPMTREVSHQESFEKALYSDQAELLTRQDSRRPALRHHLLQRVARRRYPRPV